MQRFCISVAEAVKSPVVWIIDAEQWPRALLCAEVLERGFDAAGFVTIEDALAADPSRHPEAIVLDARGQQLTPERVAKLFDLGAPTILLGGAMELNERWLHDFRWAAVVPRPVSLGAIADRVREAL